VNNLDDLIYALFLSGSYYSEETIKSLYKSDEQNFLKYLNFIFDLEFQELIYKWIGKEFSCKFTQDEVDRAFHLLALFYHEEGLTRYLKERGVTEEQVRKFKLGSTHCVLDKKKFEKFLNKLRKEVCKELVIRLLDYHENLFTVVSQIHGSPHHVTVPSFDIKGSCRGICYRAISYNKVSQWKNIHKFHFSHGPSYCFGEHNLNKFNSFFIVEGVFDALALEKIGIENSIALGNCTLSDFQYRKLKHKDLYFIFDNDKGGLFGLRKLRGRVLEEGSNIKKLTVVPERGKDVSDLAQTEPKKLKEFFIEMK